jgi:hypothetical protein
MRRRFRRRSTRWSERSCDPCLHEGRALHKRPIAKLEDVPEEGYWDSFISPGKITDAA